MNDHLSYEKSERSDSDDYRNCYKKKQLTRIRECIKYFMPETLSRTKQAKNDYYLNICNITLAIKIFYNSANCFRNCFTHIKVFLTVLN